MHAAVVTVDIAQGQFEGSKKILTEQIVPRVRGSHVILFPVAFPSSSNPEPSACWTGRGVA